MATTSHSSPDNSKDLSKKEGSELRGLEDANILGGNSAKDIGGGENTQLTPTPTLITKWQHFEKFTEELKPITEQLNDLMKRYEIFPIQDFITFPVSHGAITPFINYDAFPTSFASIPNK